MSSYVDFGADRTPVTSDPARPEMDRPVGAEMDDRGDSGRRGVLGRAIGVAALVVGLQVLLVALFAWPAIKIGGGILVG